MPASKNRKQRNNNHEISMETLIDNAPKIMSKFGKFQILSLLMICPALHVIGIFSMSPVFLNIVPNHQCKQKVFNKSQDNNSSFKFALFGFNSSDKYLKKQCYKFPIFKNTSEIQSEKRLEKLEKCQSGWIYDSSDGNTAVSEFDLICDSAWKRPFAVSAIMFGILVGGLYGGVLSDRYGRRCIALWSVLASLLSNIAMSYSFNYWFYFFFMFVKGNVYSLVFFVSYIWGMELVSSGNKRALAGFIMNIAFTSGAMLLSLLALLTKDWKWIFRSMAIMNFITLPLLWLTPESPKWLLGRHKLKEAAQVLRRIVKTNKIILDITLDDLETENLQTNLPFAEEKEEKLEVRLLWRNPILRRRLLILCLLWNFVCADYYIMAFNSANIGGNVKVNNLIGCALDIISVAAITVAMKKFGRRYTTVLMLSVTACLCIANPFLKQLNETVSVAMGLAGRLFTTATMMLATLFTGEFFPTTLRSTSVAVVSVSARFAGMLSPFVIFVGKEIDLSIPFYVMGGASMVAVYLMYLLPETSKSLLPATLKDALYLKDPSFIPRFLNISIFRNKTEGFKNSFAEDENKFSREKENQV